MLLKFIVRAFLTICVTFCCASCSMLGDPDQSFSWDLPGNFPAPRVPEDNPMTRAKVELGRHLFYDKRMSVNGTTACATCHQQKLAFTDGKALAVGATGESHPRGSMSLANVGYVPRLTWANPLMKRLEHQALVPMFGSDPVEMGLGDKKVELIKTFKDDPRYQKLFARAFPSNTDPVTLDHITKALASFQRTLISGDAAFDRFSRGERAALGADAQRGMALFFSERLECFHCHNGFNFTDSVDHGNKSLGEVSFHNTGLYNLDGKGAYPKRNPGAMAITQKASDMGRFRAPTLRNVAVTAPYMHDGSIKTLEEVIDHYAAGGRLIEEGPHAGNGAKNPNKSRFIPGFILRPNEKTDLIAFLNSLTDYKFLKDERFADPFEPTIP